MMTFFMVTLLFMKLITNMQNSGFNPQGMVADINETV
jgi:hypothetical protein